MRRRMALPAAGFAAVLSAAPAMAREVPAPAPDSVVRAASAVNGTGYYNGPVALATSVSGTSYVLTDPVRTGLGCGGVDGAAYTSVDDVWGNGEAKDLETACVDALYAAQQQAEMLSSWLGRTSIDGNGNFFPIRVGFDETGIGWYGMARYVRVGNTTDEERYPTSTDLIGHEFGHAIFAYTPGGTSATNEHQGLGEGTADIFGTLTEAYADNPLDPPDYTIGEESDLKGTGPLRYMYDPTIVGHPGCYSSTIATTPEHQAAGPLDHWFYLMAEGTNPTNGQPVSPTCDGSTLTGIGIRAAGEIYYHALLSKTSGWRYGSVRSATLAAAKDLYPEDCGRYDAVKAGWNAVSVPAQSADPTCGTVPTPPTCSASSTTGASIPDAGAAVTSAITISGCSATTAASGSSVEVHITHPWRGQLEIDLIAPDGTVFGLKDTDTSDSADDVDVTFPIDLSTEGANGTWTLSVADRYTNNTGTLDGWTIRV
ncbi:MAG: hypothetical protein HKP61_15820 [Dactylosporangium sp.]|nr:M4 family metallopeptidase [Dactylosporangium sp.]NNJ62373.1 hypothetical protein [Dactylosporangium sp.]